MRVLLTSCPFLFFVRKGDTAGYSGGGGELGPCRLFFHSFILFFQCTLLMILFAYEQREREIEQWDANRFVLFQAFRRK